jgi:PST family polysaccharide transporter
LRGRNQILARPEEWVSEDADLRRRTQVGLSWSLVSGAGGQGIQFVLMLVLARMLSPNDFGLFAMASVFTGFCILLTDLGITAAVVQAPKPTTKYLSSAWWLNAVSGLGIAAVIVAVAPLLARLYGEPRLTHILDVLALGFVLSLGAVHQGVLERHLRFSALAKIELTAISFGAAAAVLTALAGGGPWSIVVGSLVRTVVASAGLLLVVPWLPSRDVGREELARLWAFGGRLTGFATANYWSRNFDNFLIGRQLGADALGIYSRAYTLMFVPISQITQIIGRVMYPSLAAIQLDTDRIRRTYIRANQSIALVIFPIGVFTATYPRQIVGVLLGPEWREAAPLLQILALSSLPQAIGVGVAWIYQARARTDLLFKWGLATSASTVVAFLIGIHWGTEGVAWAWTIRAYLLALPSLWLAGSLIDMRALAVPIATWRATVAATVSGFGARLALHPRQTGSPLWLLGLALLYGALYVAFLHLLRDPLVSTFRRHVFSWLAVRVGNRR